MIRVLTKEQIRNLFYGGGVFFLVLFLAMTFDTSVTVLRHGQAYWLSADVKLERTVTLGKALWEKNDCIGCHTLLGDGAYFASELSTVYQRYNNSQEAVKSLIRYRTLGVLPSKRSMPQFHFTEQELDAIVEFLKYSSRIDTAHWPPHKEG